MYQQHFNAPGCQDVRKICIISMMLFFYKGSLHCKVYIISNWFPKTCQKPAWFCAATPNRSVSILNL